MEANKVIINTNGKDSSPHEIFGVTEKRMDELVSLCQEKANERFPDVDFCTPAQFASIIVEVCENETELAANMYVFGRITQLQADVEI